MPRRSGEYFQDRIFPEAEIEARLPTLPEMLASIRETDLLNDREKRIMELHLSGASYKQITEEFGWKASSRTLVAGAIARGKLVIRKIYGFDKGIVL